MLHPQCACDGRTRSRADILKHLARSGLIVRVDSVQEAGSAELPLTAPRRVRGGTHVLEHLGVADNRDHI